MQGLQATERKQLERVVLEETFSIFDTDGKGAITAESIAKTRIHALFFAET